MFVISYFYSCIMLGKIPDNITNANSINRNNGSKIKMKEIPFKN